jgi:hypothetical protein
VKNIGEAALTIITSDHFPCSYKVIHLHCYSEYKTHRLSCWRQYCVVWITLGEWRWGLTMGMHGSGENKKTCPMLASDMRSGNALGSTGSAAEKTMITITEIWGRKHGN